jgi:hypothetical protein
MIDENMHNATKSLSQNEKAIVVYEEYERAFYEENFKIYHNIEFQIAMNKYILHSQFMEEKICFMYEDDFIPILERMLEQEWIEENERLKEEEKAKKRRIIYRSECNKLESISKKLDVINEAKKFEEKRNFFRNQFCIDNKVIFSKKVWRHLKRHEIHLYSNNKKIYFNTKASKNINEKEGIILDWNSITKIMNKNFDIQTFLGTIDSYRCKKTLHSNHERTQS